MALPEAGHKGHVYLFLFLYGLSKISGYGALFFKIVDTGLKPTEQTIGIPFVIPPCTPPERFVVVTTFPFASVAKDRYFHSLLKSSRHPSPISKLRTAGKLNIAFADLLQIYRKRVLLNQQEYVSLPHISQYHQESPSRFALNIALFIRVSATTSGQRM